MTFEEKFNNDMHKGKEIDGMVRFNGHFMGEDSNGATTVKFDNGNFYVFKNKKIIDHIDGQDEYFINNQITDTIHSFILSHPLMSRDYDYSDYNAENRIEFYFSERKAKGNTRSVLLRLVINRDSKNIEISNIFIDKSLEHNGFGKKIIKEIFEIAEKHKYRLFLVLMMPGFYHRMITRGAVDIEFENIIEITSATNLR